MSSSFASNVALSLCAGLLFSLKGCGLTSELSEDDLSFTPASADALILIGVVDAPQHYEVRFSPHTGAGPREAGAFQTYGVHFSTVAEHGFDLEGEGDADRPISHAVLMAPPGRYVMTDVVAHDGILDEGVAIDLCMGTVAFTARPGVVTYVGDFAIRREGEGGRTSAGVQFLDTDFDAARRYLTTRAGIIAELRKADLDKTVFLPPDRRDGPCVRRFFGR